MPVFSRIVLFVGCGIDPTMAEAVVEQISQVNPALAADLAALVYDFRFDTLQQLLEERGNDKQT